MTVQNDFLPFAAANGANVVDQPTYAGLGVRSTGMLSGVAPSAVFNKPLRQMSIMAAVMAQAIVDQTGQPAIDDGTIATLEANFIKAIKVLGGAPIYTNAPATVGYGNYAVDTSAGAFTLTLPASPPAGTILQFQDYTGTWARNALTIARNGSTIAGNASDLICNVAGEQFELLFTGSDWRIN